MASLRSRKTPLDSANDEAASPKRRKIRKGTFSCWQCKNHKIRCIFETADSVNCVACIRNGRQCISQEFEEEVEHGHDLMESQISRVEGLVARLAEQRNYQQLRLQRIAAIQTNSPSQQSHDRLSSPGRQASGRASTATMCSPFSLLATAGQDIVSRCRSLGIFSARLCLTLE